MASMMAPTRSALTAVCAAILTGCAAIPTSAAQDRGVLDAPASSLTYADLADLGSAADLVVRATVKKQAEVEPERAPGLAPGHVRLYVEAETQALVAGSVPLGESLRYLVDMPLDEKGRAPKLKNRDVLLFARPVAGRPGELQLIGDGAQQTWTPALNDRLRAVLTDLAAPDSPPVVTGIRDALSVAGNLAGESETQIFLETENNGPVSLTVVQRPGMAPVWGVSWTEIVDQAARPPQRDTLSWYRLACFLPAQLPASANFSRVAADRERAARDYALVMTQLGDCPRSLDR